MQFSRSNLLFVIALCVGTAAWSEPVTLKNGSDTFIAGAVINETIDASGDTFVAARSAVANGTSRGDLHVAGYDISVSTDVSEDLYAFGATVVVRGSIAQDLTAAGFSVRTDSTSETKGNARLFGNSLTIEGPVQGALMVTGRDVILNAPIAGDARVFAQTLTFGPNALIGGTLTYSSEQEIVVPERVAPAERVVFEKFTNSRAWDEWDNMREMPGLPAFMSMLSVFVISLLFFLALGALMLGFMPKRLERMQQGIAAAPGQSILLGALGLSVLFGMVPITALTIIGLPFAPIVLLAIVVAWIFGYALGAYSVAMRIWTGFGGEAEPSNLSRLLIFAAAIIFIALLHYIPFVGWIANYTLVLLGTGAMTRAIFKSIMGEPGLALDIDKKPVKD